MTSPSLILAAALLLQAPAKPLVSEAGGFRVAMPGPIQEQVQKVDTPIGPIELHVSLADKGDLAYYASYADYPLATALADPDRLLEGGVAGAVANTKGKLLLKRNITLDGYPGKEFVADVPIPGVEQAILKARIFMVNARLYQVFLVGSRAKVEGGIAEPYFKSFALTKTPPKAAIKPLEPGKAFASAEGRFRVRLPGTPREVTQNLETAVGPVVMRMYVVDRGDVAYFASYADYPEGIRAANADNTLEGVVAASVAAGHGEVLDKRNVELDGHPGKEIQFTLRLPDGKPGMARSRIYLVEQRLYQIFVVATKEKDDAKDADAYVRSFTLIRPPTP